MTMLLQLRACCLQCEYETLWLTADIDTYKHVNVMATVQAANRHSRLNPDHLVEVQQKGIGK